MADTAAEFTRIALLESLIEAQLVASILSEREIPHRIRSFHDTAYDGLFQVQKGWGELCAPNAFGPQLLEIIEDIRRTDLQAAQEPMEG